MFFHDEASAIELLTAAETYPAHHRAIGTWLQYRIDTVYRWDDVADAYEQLAVDLADRRVRRGSASGRRSGADRWNAPTLAPPTAAAGDAEREPSATPVMADAATVAGG
jgi:hypothetical protein